MIVTATQIEITRLTGFLHFVLGVRSVKKQLNQDDGVEFFEFQGLCTLSAWMSLDEMKRFRNSGAHLEAMKRLRKIGRAKSITWEAPTAPSWDEAKLRLKSVQFRTEKSG